MSKMTTPHLKIVSNTPPPFVVEQVRQMWPMRDTAEIAAMLSRRWEQTVTEAQVWNALAIVTKSNR